LNPRNVGPSQSFGFFETLRLFLAEVVPAVIIRFVSRLRRLVLPDRFLFIVGRLYGRRGILSESEYACLAEVVQARRQEHHFLLTAWVFLPDPWHAIIFPRSPLTLSRVMESIQVSSTRLIHSARGQRGVLRQRRFFDPVPLPLNIFVAGRRRALRTVKEYNQKVEYIRLNPVKAGLVGSPKDWL